MDVNGSGRGYLGQVTGLALGGVADILRWTGRCGLSEWDAVHVALLL